MISTFKGEAARDLYSSNNSGPSCNATRVESLPISHDEVYRFGYDPKRGVTLEFSN